MKTEHEQKDMIQIIINSRKIIYVVIAILLINCLCIPTSYFYYNSQINNIKSQITAILEPNYSINFNSHDMQQINGYFDRLNNSKKIKQNIKHFLKKKNKAINQSLTMYKMLFTQIICLFIFSVIATIIGSILFNKRQENQKLFLSIKELSQKEYDEKINHFDIVKIYKNLDYIQPNILSINDETQNIQMLENNKNIYVFSNGDVAQLKDEVSINIDETKIKIVENAKI